MSPILTRYYVTITWDDFPEGGSYGTVVDATDHTDAENLCRFEMAETRCEDAEPESDESYPSYWIEQYKDTWHVVDCFPLDEFINRHIRR